jgi:exopolyphosphatase/guanosine-5'-triphosphate,3'-diphosphate pyrophosphatase
MRIAVIDVGTNSVLLLICQLEDRLVKTICDRAVITRLGEELSEKGDLSREAMRRTAEAVSGYLDLSWDMGADRVEIIGTSALREARNSDEFIGMVRRQTGSPIRVISGEEEARLSFISVACDPSLPLPEGLIAVTDIGGGSTEVILGRGREMLLHRSFDIGAVKLTERFLRSDPPGKVEIEELMRYLREVWERIETVAVQALVGIGGTVTTMGAMKLQMAEFDPTAVHGMKFSVEEVEGSLYRLASMSVSERAELPGMESGRADIIVAGIAILLSLMRRFNLSKMTVSSRGLRYGVIFEEAKAVCGRGSDSP